MITVLESYQFGKHRDVLDQMYRLRARVFGQKLGWDVNVVDGREKDRYDGLNPLYLLYTDDDSGAVLASLRLLPTTGPTLLYEVFGRSIPDGAAFQSPTVWECTRFCVDEEAIARYGCEDAGRISSLMMLALCEVGLRSGIEMIVANFEPPMLRVYRKAGCRVDVLGRTDEFGGRPVCLGGFEVSREVLAAMRSRLGVMGSVLTPRHGADFRLAA